jgi:hypothetical protein
MDRVQTLAWFLLFASGVLVGLSGSSVGVAVGIGNGVLSIAGH